MFDVLAYLFEQYQDPEACRDRDTMMRQLDWRSLLNFEVLCYGGFQVLPWARQGGVLLSTHLPALGCMQFIVARKRTIPLTLNPMKQSKSKTPIRQTVGATRQYRKP